MTNSEEYIIDDPEILEKVNQYTDWQLLPKRHFMRYVERGRQGMNLGLPNGLVNVNKYVYGTKKGRYILIGADSGTGKTTLTDFMLVLNAYEHCKKHGKKLHIHYFSFEISRHMKTLKWVGFYVFYKFGVRLPGAYIGGDVPDKPVTEEHMKMVRVAYAYVEQLMDAITFIEDPIWPTAIYLHMLKHYESIGTVIRGPKTQQHVHGLITGYEPNEGQEDAVTIMLIDHMALVASESNMDTKRTMDLMSKYIVILRNIFDMSAGIVQQFNSELTTVNRNSFKQVTEGSVMPQRVDFGDSTYTYRDADIVYGLISPAKFDMKEFFGYDVRSLKAFLIIMCLMKNRYGSADKALPLFIDPIAGVFYDLPPSNMMGEFLTMKQEIETCQLNYQIGH